jgi:hypothetical protein
MKRATASLVCGPDGFAPVDHPSVRWLDREADYLLVREAWEQRGGSP